MTLGLGLFSGVLVATAAAGLAAIGVDRLHALADDGQLEARRVARHLLTVRARLLLGRVLAVTLAAGAAVALALPSGPGPALASLLSVALGYAFVAEVLAALARRRPEVLGLRLLRWLRPIEWLLAPLAVPIVAVGRVAQRLLPAPEAQEDVAARAALHLFERSAELGELAGEQVRLLRNALEVPGTIAREVMVPRTQVEAFEMATPLEEVLERIVVSGHSRYPVFRERIDQVEGILYAKDLFRRLQEGGVLDGAGLATLIRPAFMVPETTRIDELLRVMQSRRFHLAIVVDEFGGAAGIVTLEDILEEIVGEIEDEHDPSLHRIDQRAEGHYVADASMSLYDLEEMIGGDLAPNAVEADSLGGLIVEASGRVPAEGETLRLGDFDVRVLAADDRRITQVEIIRGPPPTPDDPVAEAS
ncbi:MAG: hemolysin family protein [Myxococcota bacterium]